MGSRIDAATENRPRSGGVVVQNLFNKTFNQIDKIQSIIIAGAGVVICEK
jgi:hypothetical protein